MEAFAVKMRYFATHTAKPRLGGVAWEVTYHCPVVGCGKEATHDRYSRRCTWRLCTSCANLFDRKPGHVHFTPGMTVPRITSDLMHRNNLAQINDGLQRKLQAAGEKGCAG